ncbi:hypothetical protein HanIR_Chr17g0848881 [Helianthus annuus]|nr:hypothetical protein HanIR_Chr17g0848881 [Helianthus annuus]
MVRIHPSQPNTTRFHNTRHRNHIRHKRKHPVFVTPTRSRRSLLTTLLLHSNKPRFTRKRSIVNTPFTLTEIQNLLDSALLYPEPPFFPPLTPSNDLNSEKFNSLVPKNPVLPLFPLSPPDLAFSLGFSNRTCF